MAGVENRKSFEGTSATGKVLTGSSFSTLSSWQRRLLTSSSSRVSAGGPHRSEWRLWNSSWS